MQQKKSNYQVISLFILIFMFSSCNTAQQQNNEGTYFKVADTYYQSWRKDDNYKGTELVVKLKDVHPDILFSHLTFRGMKMVPSVETSQGTTTLKANFETGIKKTENSPQTQTDLGNMVLFQVKEEEKQFPLKSIRREKTRHF